MGTRLSRGTTKKGDVDATVQRVLRMAFSWEEIEDGVMTMICSPCRNRPTDNSVVKEQGLRPKLY